MPLSAPSSTALPSGSKTLCTCGCGKRVSKRTAARHLAGKAPVRFRASRQADELSDPDDATWDLQAEARPVKRFRGNKSLPPQPTSDPNDGLPAPGPELDPLDYAPDTFDTNEDSHSPAVCSVLPSLVNANLFK